MVHTVHNIILSLLTVKGRDFGTSSLYGIEEMSV